MRREDQGSAGVSTRGGDTLAAQRSAQLVAIASPLRGRRGFAARRLSPSSIYPREAVRRFAEAHGLAIAGDLRPGKMDGRAWRSPRGGGGWRHQEVKRRIKPTIAFRHPAEHWPCPTIFLPCHSVACGAL
jgi:hypothetical protein